jgi:hypothetical protein
MCSARHIALVRVFIVKFIVVILKGGKTSSQAGTTVRRLCAGMLPERVGEE